MLGELRDQHPNVGVLVDAFHLFAAGEELEAGFVWGDDRVVWVHVADCSQPGSRRDAGSGTRACRAKPAWRLPGPSEQLATRATTARSPPSRSGHADRCRDWIR